MKKTGRVGGPFFLHGVRLVGFCNDDKKTQIIVYFFSRWPLLCVLATVLGSRMTYDKSTLDVFRFFRNFPSREPNRGASNVTFFLFNFGDTHENDDKS